MHSTLYFFVTDKVHMLDLSGILQVFHESTQFGLDYRIEYISIRPSITASSGLVLSNLKNFDQFTPGKNDIICIPGSKSRKSDNDELKPFSAWLKAAHAEGAKICSVCSGAFILAESGLLDHRSCTTHWALIDQLERNYPKLLVKKNILFTKEQNIYTSAGFTTGIDLGLYLMEEQHGSEIAARLARELVVYIRRDGRDQQLSIYLRYRSHQDQKVHTIQDWIIENIDKKANLEVLADLVHTSPRNLSRIFKDKTGVSVSAFRNKVRFEKAKSLLKNTSYKMTHIARLCGYSSTKQFRSLIGKHENLS